MEAKNYIEVETPEVALMWPFLLEARETLSGDKEFQVKFLMKENIWKNSNLRVVISQLLKDHGVDPKRLAQPFYKSGNEIFMEDPQKNAQFEDLYHDALQFRCKRKEEKEAPTVVDTDGNKLSEVEIKTLGNGSLGKLLVYVTLTRNPKVTSQKYITLFLKAIQVTKHVEYVKTETVSFSKYNGEHGFTTSNPAAGFSGSGMAASSFEEDNIDF